jgi:ketosteroid isomerase-like protein
MTTLVALLIAAVVQAPPSAATVEATHKQFRELETKLMGAVQLRSTETLEALVSPRFGFSLMVEGREPEVLSRSEWFGMTNAHARLEGFEIRSVAAGTSGDHAFVRVQVARKGAVGSREVSGEHVLVDLWAKEGGAWKLLYRVVARPLAPPSR